MDKEEAEALELTKDELLARAALGESAKLARKPRDLNQRAAAIVSEATAEAVRIRVVTADELGSIVVSGSTFEMSRPIRISGLPSVTVKGNTFL